eukprot:CAMPEP_0181241284 /NCGR_PEP_ID=MMETSP1096-20121128/41036_1 /TAXON_ID=156174 ORGANISM="Chrysochromulina ericina, Strain CCMP281" /NCGR_SAMPLE_ID=MMETSP1096 /ASSEMBLY_ACC=CAM_ASM_000453 /LENGTH=71 /DNA_ID=CAMNT_0023337339 /DNA_START=344 /DNA_END=555 /DNA_ORIENTATION=-
MHSKGGDAAALALLLLLPLPPLCLPQVAAAALDRRTRLALWDYWQIGKEDATACALTYVRPLLAVAPIPLL